MLWLVWISGAGLKIRSSAFLFFWTIMSEYLNGAMVLFILFTIYLFIFFLVNLCHFVLFDSILGFFFSSICFFFRISDILLFLPCK